MGTLKAALLAALATLAGAHAEEKATIGADLQLVSEVAAIEPGRPFTVALHIHHHEGYHTYWKAPGIVGVPTSIEWTLPPGFQAGPIRWPAPEVVDMATHPAHGYHRDVLLLVEITPPAEIAAGTVTLAGAITWMACARDCNPGFGTRRLTLPVAPAAKPDPTWQPRIATERANLPAPARHWTARLESAPGESPIRLRVRPRHDPPADPGAVYFFSEDGQVSSEPPQAVTRDPDGSYLITAERSEWGPEEYVSLPGVLVASKSWQAGKRRPAIRIAPRYAPNR